MGNSCGVVLGVVVLPPPVETGGYSRETPSELYFWEVGCLCFFNR